MKHPSYDREMKEVYAHIYQDFYDLTPQQLDSAETIILKNMKEMGISRNDLRQMNALNIGTGRETIVLHRLGAKKVFHFDLSEKSVSQLRKLKERDPQFKNLFTQQLDVCTPEGIGLEDRIDFIYLNGVFHHLHDPLGATTNLVNTLRKGAKVFMRIYRSGTLGFFVTDFLRKIIRYEHRNLFREVFHQKFPTPDVFLKSIYREAYDDLFVPTLKLYDKSELDSFFSSLGFEMILKETPPSYDHGDSRPSGQGVSLGYRLPNEIDSNFRVGSPFPSHKDQLNDFSYREPYIVETVKKMKEYLARQEFVIDSAIMDKSIDLYRESQLYLLNEEVDAAQKHVLLQRILVAEGKPR